MSKQSILFARFPFGNSECPDSSDWMHMAKEKAKADSRFGEVYTTRVDATPITMSRNRVCKQAVALKADIICMIDADMCPDQPGVGAKPFWESSIDFLLNHSGPCMVAAPYCGPPPCENIYVFQWNHHESDVPELGLQLAQFDGEEAWRMTGITEVAALPTGLILIDTRALAKIAPPYFDYEYEDPPFNTRLATTEDVFMTRNASLAGVPIYCNWNSWAVHWKRKGVGRPGLRTVESVRQDLREAIVSGRTEKERMTQVIRADVCRLSEPARLGHPIRLVNGKAEAA